MAPVVFSSSPWKSALLLLGSLAFVAIGLFIMLPDPNSSRAMAWFAIGFFGFCAVMGIVVLVRPQRLELNSSGFSVSGGLMRGQHLTHWREVEKFYVIRLPKGVKMVGFDYKPEAMPDTAMVRVAGTMGLQGSLTQGLGPSPESLAEELKLWLERAK
jgi:hypothetical protein